jgi:Luciferase-like monooxygenase
MDNSNEAHRKKIGFLSFGAWHPGGGLTHTGAEALQQTVELAVAAEKIGIDGAFVRVHHFARQLSSPFPPLAAIGVKTRRIEIGTGVIDMRYRKPAVHGRRGCSSRLACRRPAATWREPRFARACLARRRSIRLSGAVERCPR